MGEPPQNLLQLAGLIQSHINILASINLYNQGIEQIDRPTATGQTLIVEEGKQPLFEHLEIFRSVISELSMIILSRHKQFWQNEAPYASMGVDGQLIPQMLKFPPGLIEDKVLLEPKASSAMLSENTRKQELVAILDRLGASQRVILDLLNTGMQGAAQGLPIGEVAAGCADSYSNMLTRVLTEFKVRDIEEVNPPVNAMMQVGQVYQQTIMQMKQQMQQIMQQAQQLAQELKQTSQNAQQLLQENKSLTQENQTLTMALELEKIKETVNVKLAKETSKNAKSE
jgi:hypothetical protein